MSAKRLSLKQAQQAASASLGGDVDSALEDVDVSRYIQQYHQYGLRCRVLQTKLVDLEGDEAQAQADMQSCTLVLEHLQREEATVASRMRALQSELDLIQSTAATQTNRMEDLRALQQRHTETKENVARILAPLERDRDKAELIVRRLAPTVQLESHALPAGTASSAAASSHSGDRRRGAHEQHAEFAHSHAEQQSSGEYGAQAASAAGRPRVPAGSSTSAASSSSAHSSAPPADRSNAPPFSSSSSPWTFPAHPTRYYAN
jgi:hypothetical protein